LKKGFLITFLAIVSSLCLQAQNTFEPTTHIGVTGGVNISGVNFKPFTRQEGYTSYSTGLVLRHISEPNIGIQAEIIYSRKGWVESRDTAGKYERSIEVAELPVMAVFIAGRKTVRLSFGLGPYVNYRINEKETIILPDESYARPYYGKPLRDKMEGGFIVAAGFETHTKAGVFSLRSTFSHSLTNLFPLNAPEFYYESSRMMNLNASLSYMLTF